MHHHRVPCAWTCYIICGTYPFTIYIPLHNHMPLHMPIVHMFLRMSLHTSFLHKSFLHTSFLHTSFLHIVLSPLHPSRLPRASPPHRTGEGGHAVGPRLAAHEALRKAGGIARSRWQRKEQVAAQGKQVASQGAGGSARSRWHRKKSRWHRKEIRWHRKEIRWHRKESKWYRKESRWPHARVLDVVAPWPCWRPKRGGTARET